MKYQQDQQENQQPHPNFVVLEGEFVVVVDNSDFKNDSVINEKYDSQIYPDDAVL